MSQNLISMSTQKELNFDKDRKKEGQAEIMAQNIDRKAKLKQKRKFSTQLPNERYQANELGFEEE